MEIVDNIFLDMAHVFLVFSIYLFFIAYRNISDNREDNLALVVTIFSSLYIIIKFNTKVYDAIPMLLVNIPLIISYYKKNDTLILISSLIMILYYYGFYDKFFVFILLEYVLYYIIYKVMNSKKIKDFYLFISIFTIIKFLFVGIFIYILHKDYIFNVFVLCVIFYVMAIIIYYLIMKAEDALKLNMSLKETLHDKEIRTALFKITHEIKNPIAVCKGYLDMFDVSNSEHAKKYIPIMKEEIDKTLNLLEDYLSMNRIKFNKDIMDINLLLEELMNEFSLYFIEKRIVTKINLLDEEIYINGDFSRLKQVFVNIVKNSIEALKDKPCIELWTKEKNGKYYIYFKDNGIGISKENLEKIKEPFFTTKEKGTGLGTSLCDEIIRGHEGSINYESVEGEYTIVCVELPIYE